MAAGPLGRRQGIPPTPLVANVRGRSAAAEPQPFIATATDLGGAQPHDCLRGKVYADLCSEIKLETGSGGVGAQPLRKFRAFQALEKQFLHVRENHDVPHTVSKRLDEANRSEVLVASRWGVRGSPVDSMFEAVPLPSMMLLFARCELGDKLYML